MKLSLVFELLLIFVLLAFAASKHVGHKNNKKSIQKATDTGIKIEDNSINKYCKCTESLCNCCRDFAVPVVNLNGPGCASLRYLNGDKMAVSLSFGKKVITNRTLSSQKPSPVCMPLPGGVSKFCGRVYNIARQGEEFRACLGLELQAKTTVEAAVRVSCFKFGPRGVTSEPADPLPLVPQDEKVTDDDDDDDDDEDDFGLDTDDDDDDLDDDDDDDDDEGELEGVNDVESADYTGFSLLGDDILGDLFGSSGGKKTKKTQKIKSVSTTTTTTTRRPQRPTRRPSRRPYRTTTVRSTTVRVRPGQGNRRPIRKPTQQPSAPTVPDVPAESVTVATIFNAVSSVAESMKPQMTDITDTKAESTSNIQSHVMSVIPITAKIPVAEPSTTLKAETTFHDDGLESSLAHITGQLSLFPVTQIIPTDMKEPTAKPTEQMTYEKVETITPKTHSLIPFATTIEDDSPEEMVQIVDTLDSHSQEHEADKENVAEETKVEENASNHYEGLTLPRKKHRGFNLADLDVLDLTQIGESVGHQLGIFGRHKRQNKNKEPRPQNIRGANDYDDILGLETLSDSLGLPDIDDIARKDRRRQNKMMRSWSQPQ
ncbi:eisosome protein SEG2 [Aricia agestis]|uniref:eisosome protein SEG2 n=1 Tax=Aricia agestis TaxID=91739 RepID=UPI001C202954|nr:eisosome protein SEG2 [Aricia agestis]